MNRRIANIVLFLALVAAIVLAAGCTREQSKGPLPPPGGTALPTVEMPTLTPAAVAVAPATATPKPAAPAAQPTTAPAPISPPPVQPAAQPQPTAAPVPVGATPGKHTVKPGEWLYSIARLYNVNPFTLAQVNGISAPYRIYPGQQLTIPGGPPVPPPSPGTCSSPYTVQAGETIFSIARKCGKTPSAIITANSLVNPNLIFVGQKLQIP